MDLELLDAVHALERGKALKGHLGGACNKLQELGPVGLVEGAQGPPEPLDLGKRRVRAEKHGSR